MIHQFPDGNKEVLDDNKHRDGPWPYSDKQREYIKIQRAIYDQNPIRLYHGFQTKLQRRAKELDDTDEVEAETGLEVTRLSNRSLSRSHLA